MNNTIKNNKLIYTLNEVVENCFSRYAKYIIQERALPDVRDGLKPVQRRILYAMNNLNLTFNSSYKKSARIVGEVIGKYHPHGDSSVYDAIVRLSQWWKLHYPLIDMHGNNGSIDGDPAAAMRYTEIKLNEISSFLLQDLEKETVTFTSNFDDSEREPTILPSLFPNLLLNGATGIAAGYATNIPPHNLEEIINATIYKIKHMNCKLNNLTKFIKGPDFPTGGIIQGKKGILEAYKTGKGKIIIRSKIILENNKLIITEIPYEVIKQDLIKKIDNIKFLEPGLNIKNVYDETDRKGLRIVIEIKKQGNIDIIKKYLLKNTNLQITYNFNIVAIANKQPKILSLNKLLEYYIKHQIEILINKSKFELKKTKKHLEIVNGLIKAIKILNKIIFIIRNSKDRNDANNNLCNKLKFSKLQSEAIIQLKMYRLTSFNIKQLMKDKHNLESLIIKLNEILTNKSQMFEIIINQLTLIKNKFKKPRKSKIEDIIEIIEIEKIKTILTKELNIWISRDGYIKALLNNSLINIKKDKFNKKPHDIWIADFVANSCDKIILITSKGNYVIIPIYKIKISKTKDIGYHVNTISMLSGEEKIITCYLLDNFVKQNKYIMLITKLGMIKIVDLQEFNAVRINKAIKIMNLRDNDEIINSELFNNQKYILILTKKGFVVKYKYQEIPILKLKTFGVKSINLKNDDIIITAGYCDDNNDIIIFLNDNTIQQIKSNQLIINKRPSKGTNLFKNHKKNNNWIKWGFIFNKKLPQILYILQFNDEIKKIDINKNNVTSFDNNLFNLNNKNIENIFIKHFFNLKIDINN